jgi:hypothetical protein
MMSFKRVVPVLVLSMAALPACADTLNVVANGSIASHAGEGSNGFYMSTYADSSVLQTFGSAQIGNASEVTLLFPEFTLPTGAVVTGATLDLTFTPLVGGTYPTTVEQGPEPVDQGNSYVPGQINETVSTSTSTLALLAYSPVTHSGCELSNPGSSTDLVAAGFGSCLSGPEDYSVGFSSLTTLTPDLVSAGFNSWEIFNFEAGTTVDLSGDLAIDYTVTPEPSGMVLLGTGMLALMVGAWYRRAGSC